MKKVKAKNPNTIWVYWKHLLDERVRSYVVIAGAALLVIFVAQSMNGSLMAGLVPLLIGVTALGLRWTAMPVFCVIAVAWFQALPFGVPTGGRFPIDPSRTHFRIPDLLLVSAVIVYLIAQFRVYSLAHLAVPDERPVKLRISTELPETRDPDLILESEIPRIFLAMAAVVFLGQFIWLVASEVTLDFNRIPPIRVRETTAPMQNVGDSRSAVFPPQASRWLLFVLSTGLAIFATRLVLWYWRLRTLSREEAQLILADTGWYEMRREAARQETWRAYGIRRAKSKELPKLKPVPKPNVAKKPWLGAAIQRGCLLVFIAIVVAVVLVCGGVYLMDLRRN